MEMEKTTRRDRIREALDRIYDQSPSYIREYIRQYQQDPTSRIFAPLADAYRKMHRHAEAISILNEGLKHHREFHGARVCLAKCYFETKRFREAKEELAAVVQHVPENLMAQRLLGETLELLGDTGAALHAFKMAHILAPQDVALAEKIHALEKNAPDTATGVAPQTPCVENLEGTELENWLEEVRTESQAEQTPAAPMDTASLFAEDGQEPFVAEHVTKVFKDRGPSNEITSETLGDLYFAQGQFREALRIFEKLEQSAGVDTKIQACRRNLGVSQDTLMREKKIQLLRSLLKRLRSSTAAHA